MNAETTQNRDPEKRKNQITKIRNESGDITDLIEINKEDYTRILWTILCQQIRQPRWNWQIARNRLEEETKTDWRRNRKSEETYDT